VAFIEKINLRHAALAFALLCAGCSAVGSSYNWGWYIFNPFQEKGLSNLLFLVNGLWSTLAVSICAISLSVFLGVGLALAGLSKKSWLQALTRGYVELFRAIPLLVLLLWVFYGLPVIIGLQMGVFVAGVVSLSLSDSAFEAEVFRAGIQSVSKGQIEAAKSLGLSWAQQMRFIVAPQAIKVIMPALGNQFIYVVKMSSLISVIGLPELTRMANELNVNEYRPLEIYSFLVLEYLVLIVFISWLVRKLERKLSLQG
jgi:His/Glu/Gln/Arg/opine family amino acid ABC transporter permease subunit